MRKFAKDEAKMRKFADGSKAPLSKSKHKKGRKVKLSTKSGAGHKLKGVKNHKNWKQTGAKSKVA
jgi:hypothetical protein